MKSSFTPRPLSRDALSPAEAQSLQLAAKALQQAARSGGGQPLLKGKNIALLCDKADCNCAAEVDAAATQLGARVSRLRADTALPAEAARMLGQLYDAVDCEHVPPELVRRLEQQAGVPVYDGLGRADHPLFEQLAKDGSAADRHFLLQALLISTIG